MKRWLLGGLLLWFPWLVRAADSSLSFNPPASDYSMIFLGDLFGVVDGVLHGTGSQIMGSMFGVFNAAVLALGGIIVTYTLMVSTMNTAHEGQMLGQKWSSIWIPMRSTLGLALLIPKASGYCLMQIFVMWIVVQGVGAADKVWNAALDYLSRGGVIVQAQTGSKENNKASTQLNLGNSAQDILAGQVCMLGIENYLKNKRQDFQALEQKQTPVGPCHSPSSQSISDFCKTPVPDFLNTINVVNVRENAFEQYRQKRAQDPKATKPTSFKVSMPNFNQAPYNVLNGICGTITWKEFDSKDEESIDKIVSGENASTAKLAVTIALQQMYQDLGQLAGIMVNNNPKLSGINLANESSATSVAYQPFGIPLDSNGQACSSTDCTTWGLAAGTSSTPLLTGAGLQSAISDFGAIISPTLKLIDEGKHNNSNSADTKAIEDAKSQGWIMAGSYFFNLVSLNKAHSNAWDDLAKKLSYDKNSFVSVKADISGELNQVCAADSSYHTLCEWSNSKQSEISDYIVKMIGERAEIPPSDSDYNAVTGTPASTVYGYTFNSSILKIPGQPGLGEPSRLNKTNTLSYKIYELPSIHTHGKWGWVARILYDIISTVMDAIITVITTLLQVAFTVMIWTPLQAALEIFSYGMKLLDQKDVNPIIALAQMGNFYINFAMNTWVAIMGISITIAMVPVLGVVIFVLLGLVLPIILAWLSMMTAIGFFTSFYVPFVPYLLFLFGSIAWLIVVIEAMVAAPIVALGVSHPEGHDAFGKAEPAIMILMNVFLRPAMMIIGFISGIALSYVGVWVLNAGFTNASSVYDTTGSEQAITFTGWTATFASFFLILMYVSLYVAIVQQAFSLISTLPDKVLRWIGGQPESSGQEAARWGDEAKSKVEEGGKSTMEGQSAGARQMAGKVGGAFGKMAEKSGSSVKASGDSSKDDGGGDGDSGDSTPGNDNNGLPGGSDDSSDEDAPTDPKGSGGLPTE